eukprot:TRINITY_DN14821_c0_g1_i1.p1 TRINITY_DN14821_c0_g1~~TRINITY_DN14821_c0_g1_i1.p1  ORF type:complete len:391 (-),score=60.88 TRINITY_DN14821_c0_g1_i1:45-1217(-)
MRRALQLHGRRQLPRTRLPTLQRTGHGKDTAAGIHQTAELRAFETHLTDHGAEISGVRAGSAGEGRGIGVFALRRFAEGETVISVPRRLCLKEEILITDEEMRRETLVAQAPLHEAAGGAAGVWYDLMGYLPGRQAVANLALKLLAARSSGSAHASFHYCATLPQDLPPALHPLNAAPWDPELITKSPSLSRLYREAVACNDACLQLMLSAERPASHLRPASDAEARWALGAVATRNFGLYGGIDGGRQTLALVPYLDLLNHASPTSESSPACAFEEQGDNLCFLAARSIEAGEELAWEYSASSDAGLLCHYGIARHPFAAPNERNEAAVTLSIDYVRHKLGAAGWSQPAEVNRLLEALRNKGWTQLDRDLVAFAGSRFLFQGWYKTSLV